MPISWTSISGFFYEEEGQLLQSFCVGKAVLEIGSFTGRSTCCLSDVAQVVHAVDTWSSDGGGQVQIENSPIFGEFSVNTAGRTNIIPFRGDAYDIVPTLEDSFYDLVFIDAMHVHECVERNILDSYPKVKNDGFFAFHDYNDDFSEWGEVKMTVDEYFDPSQGVRALHLIVLPKTAFRKEKL